jgi:hypothetical protein
MGGNPQTGGRHSVAPRLGSILGDLRVKPAEWQLRISVIELTRAAPAKRTSKLRPPPRRSAIVRLNDLAGDRNDPLCKGVTMGPSTVTNLIGAGVEGFDRQSLDPPSPVAEAHCGARAR